MAGFIAGIINRNPGAAQLIIEPTNPGNHSPAFHAGVAVQANAISTTMDSRTCTISATDMEDR